MADKPGVVGLRISQGGALLQIIVKERVIQREGHETCPQTTVHRVYGESDKLVSVVAEFMPLSRNASLDSYQPVEWLPCA